MSNGGNTTVGVLGYGRFGRALADLMIENQIPVRAFDTRTSVPESLLCASPADLAQKSKIIVLAVPILSFESAILTIKDNLTSGHIIIDVGSVKIGPTALFERELGNAIQWVATHPLFGPATLARGERPLRAIVCPNETHPDAVREIASLYQRMGCEIIEQDAEAHDRLMAETHALAYFLSKGLTDIGAGENVAFTPPSFQAIAHMIETVRADAGHLFYSIQHENPYAASARRKLLDALADLDEQIDSVRMTPESVPPLSIPDLGRLSPDLQETRDLIDELDRELCELLARRAQLSKRVAHTKSEHGAPIRDPERERQVLDRRAEWAQDLGLDDQAVRELFETIMRFSRRIQRQ